MKRVDISLGGEYAIAQGNHLPVRGIIVGFMTGHGVVIKWPDHPVQTSETVAYHRVLRLWSEQTDPSYWLARFPNNANLQAAVTSAAARNKPHLLVQGAAVSVPIEYDDDEKIVCYQLAPVPKKTRLKWRQAAQDFREQLE